MSVARVFEGDERFKGVAMRVMLALVPFADENIIMEKAAELAAEGKLDTNAVNALIDPKKETKAETVQSKAETVNRRRTRLRPQKLCKDMQPLRISS